MLKSITIRWEVVPGNPAQVMYYVDDSPVGRDNEGFEQVLDAIRSNKNVQVSLRIRNVSVGGESLIASLPFRERFTELREALGENKLTYDFY